MFKTVLLLSFLGFSALFAKSTVFTAPGTPLKFLSRLPLENSEITAYMPSRKALFCVGGHSSLSVVDLSQPAVPVLKKQILLQGEATSVSVSGDLVAVSLISTPETASGFVQIFRYTDSLRTLGRYQVGAGPDMVTFTSDGKTLLVACEGAPSSNYQVDPKGTIGILSLPSAFFYSDTLKLQTNSAENSVTNEKMSKTQSQITLLDFSALDTIALLKKGVRNSGLGSFAQNMEPEYITVDSSGNFAWVTLQENNAIAKIDIVQKKIIDVFPLGVLDHRLKGNGFDFENENGIHIRQAPVLGLRQPDGVSAFIYQGKPWLLTANEGASMRYPAWNDETNVLDQFQKGLLNMDIFDAQILTELQGLEISRVEKCDSFPAHKCPVIYAFGSRSMSLFDGESGTLVWDSGDQIEQMLSKVVPKYFNQNSKKKKHKKDARSDDSGSEPENVTVGNVNGKKLAFLGLERMSGIVIWNLDNPKKPQLEGYYLDLKDRGPEGLVFISAENSPVRGISLLVVGYEYSQNLTIYQVIQEKRLRK